MNKIEDLEKILRQLRDPEKGCPWDKKQTSLSLIPNFIEEVYEAVEAIEDSDDTHLCEELGDILLHIIFQTHIAEDSGKFDLSDVIGKVVQKLIRRHPHIFPPDEPTENLVSLDPESQISVSDVKLNWENIKLAEKKDSRVSVLEGVPRNLPALIQAHRIQEKAAAIGFDWDSIEPVFDKINEEIEEVKAEIKSGDRAALVDEVGDLFFAVVNLSRMLKVDAETALRQSNEKFKKRFMIVEQLALQKGIVMSEVGLEVLDELWEIAKKV
ncbi:MAG: nucleoside triphosphate pyrophosphohydrolase [Candidatus Cloacimonetes bacterium]|nr:nucleoside triphosphate pyrophosphohydrolase [Candidatus Cloacimonadota bacterium]